MDAMQQTLVMAVHDYNFKDGAFKNEITNTTPCIDAMNILLNSDLLSAEEKAPVQKTRQKVLTVINRAPNLTLLEFVKLAGSHDITDMFEADCKKRGQYVPPFMIQKVGSDGKVEETIEITNDGEKKTKGGKHGQYPSAPAEFNQRQEEMMSELGLGEHAKTSTHRAEGAKGGVESDQSPMDTTTTGAKAGGNRKTGAGESPILMLTTITTPRDVTNIRRRYVHKQGSVRRGLRSHVQEEPSWGLLVT